MNWHKKHKESLTFGQKCADKMRNIMGSWGFVFGFLAAMCSWALVNMAILTTHAFDPYPFILLNLLLSTLAGLQGAILLIAAKRQDQISAALAQHDFDTNLEAKAEIELILQEIKKLNEILKLLKKGRKNS